MTRRLRKRGSPLVAKLRAELEECRATLDAIRTGAVDAIVVQGAQGPQIFEASERSYRVLVEAMNEGAATVDEQGVVLYSNPFFATMLGRPLSELMGVSLRNWVGPDHVATFDALLAQGRKRDSKGAVVLTGAGGREVPALLSVNAMRSSASKAKQVLCLIATDLSEHVRNEEMIASERLARSMLEQAAEAIIVCDPESLIVRASNAAHLLCNGNPLLRPFAEVFPLVIEDEPRTIPQIAMQRQIVNGLPAVFLRADEPLSLLLSAGPLIGGRDQVLGCVVTLTDVTRLKTVETDLQAAVRAREDFLSIASHELRTPLTAMTLHLQSLQMLMARAFGADLDGRIAHKLEITMRQADQLTRLIDGLLDVTQITSGKQVQVNQELDLIALVRDVVERCRGQADRAGCTLELEADGSIFGSWDPMQLEQVLTNLVGNAIKYGPAKPIRVTVCADGDHARIEVRDHGIGIAEHDRGRIFERFERAVSPHHYGGLGLGLFIARRIVQAYGGTIVVDSRPGEGSAFTVHLPRKAA